MLPAAGAILLYRRHQKKKREAERTAKLEQVALSKVRVRQQSRRLTVPAKKLVRGGEPDEED